MKTLHSTTRRQFIRMSAGATLLVTPILRETRALAQAAAPRRLVFFQIPLGTVSGFFPSGVPTALHAAAATSPLATLSPILMPLAPYKDKLLVASGMERNPELALVNPSASQDPGHKELGTILTGRMCSGLDDKSRHGNISVDQFIKTKLPATMKEKSLQLGCWKPGSGPTNGLVSADRLVASATGPSSPVLPELDPAKVFQRVFGGITTGTTGPAPDPAVAKLSAQRQSVLDAVNKEITNMQAKLSGSERAKLDHHMTSIRELETVLLPTTVAAGCSKPQIAGISTGGTSQAYARAMIDIVANAMTCDLARVAVITTGIGRENSAFMGTNSGSVEWHDAYTHGNGSGWIEHAKIHTWYVTQFAYMVQKFKDLGMLDSSALVHFSEEGMRFQGTGSGGYTFKQEHNSRYWYPYVIAGSGGGYFKQGVQVNVKKDQGSKNFIFNCLRMMGIQDTMMGNVTANPIAELAA